MVFTMQAREREDVTMTEGVLAWPNGRPSTIHLMRRVSRRVAACWSAAVTTGLSTAQFGVLAALRDGEPLDQQSIGTRTGIDKGTGTYIIERLCREGLVEARTDPDNRRRRLVTLTEEGARVVNQTMAEAVQAEKLVASRLSAEEWDQLNQLLMRMLGAVPATVNGSQAPSH